MSNKKHEIELKEIDYHFKVNGIPVMVTYQENIRRSWVVFKGVNVYESSRICWTQPQALEVLHSYLLSIK